MPSPTTPRSNPATSSCCAPTSTSSPRSSTPRSAPPSPTPPATPPPRPPGPSTGACLASRTDWPTGRCARPTRCWPPSTPCSSWSTAASPRPSWSGSSVGSRSATRFRFDDDDIERIADWTDQANIRWGLDAARRERYWLGDVDDNTWRAGIDRLLLGVAMATDGSRLLGGRLPLDDVESGDVDLAGRFAELVDRLDTVVTDAALSRGRSTSGRTSSGRRSTC